MTNAQIEDTGSHDVAMDVRRFPILPQLIGLVCVALGLLGLGGDIYTFTQPAMLATTLAWIHIIGVLIDILFLVAGVGIMLKKKCLYLLAMGNCFICPIYTVTIWPFLHWDQLITVSGHHLPEQAISVGVFMVKSMTILICVLLPAVFFVALGLYYRRINPNTWR